MDTNADGQIHLWNVHDGVTALVGAQQRFNIVGRIEHPVETLALDARLNGGPWFPIAVNLTGRPRAARLPAAGDFNIDAINVEDLQPSNVLEVRQTRTDGKKFATRVRFDIRRTDPTDHRFTLSLRPGEIEEFGQVVDGGWRVVRDEDGLSLGISRETAGYDRIVLFGDRRWTTGYEIEACLTVDEWTHCVHNVGLLFKWNPHRAGTGAELPVTWSTGLAYYASSSPGLRLRFGVNVTYSNGVRHGDYVLQERPRAWWTRIPRRATAVVWYVSRRRWVLSQLRPGIRYRFHARVDPSAYTLSVWRDGRRAPRSPQLLVHTPPELLERGAVGLIAENAVVRLHQFSVHPVGGRGDGSGAEATAAASSDLEKRD